MTSTSDQLEPRQPRRKKFEVVADHQRLILDWMLGQGGTANVYHAYDPQLGRSVAVKLLPPAASLDAKCRARFVREIQITAALDHPHVVPVYATGETDDAPYLEMRAICGRSLTQIVADLQARVHSRQELTGQALLELAKPDNTHVENEDAAVPRLAVCAAPCYYRQLAQWLAAMASALEHVHARGFLHGDVKPANVLVEPNGHIWLIDFGTACELGAGESGAEHVAAGTLPYLAPERLDGNAAPDVRQDVYGLGATLYELLTLRRPLAGQTAQALMRELATKPPVSPRKLAPTTPRALEAIAMRALARRPEDRFATMKDVEQALLAYARTAEEATQPHTRWRSRRSTIVAVTLLVVFSAAFFLVPARTPSLAERAAHLAEHLPPGLQAELPGEQSRRLLISGVMQLGREPFELPLDLTARDRVTWRIEPRPSLSHAGHSYTTTPHRSGWLAAEDLAQAWGGHLVAINDQAEQEFLSGTLLGKDPRGEFPILWIGLSADDKGAEYRWSSGEPVTFRNWNPGEPSRGWGVERFVAANWHLVNNDIDRDGQVGDWNDVPETGLRTADGYPGLIELPFEQPTSPPVLLVRKRDGTRTTVPPQGNRLSAPGRLVLERAGDARQLINVTISVE